MTLPRFAIVVGFAFIALAVVLSTVSAYAAWLAMDLKWSGAPSALSVEMTYLGLSYLVPSVALLAAGLVLVLLGRLVIAAECLAKRMDE